MKRVIYFLLVLPLLFSCEEDLPSTTTVTDSTNIVINLPDTTKTEITHNESANLLVSLKDANGNPIADQGVHLYSGSLFVNHLITDAEGNADFGRLLTGAYNIQVKDIALNDQAYFVYQYIQIIPGHDKLLEIVPEEYVANLEVSVYERAYAPDYLKKPSANYTVLAILSDEYDGTLMPIEEMRKIAFKESTTDTLGKVSMQLPADVSFVIVAFEDDIYKESNYIRLNKGETGTMNLNFWLNTLHVQVSRYGDRGGVADANILVIRSSDYYQYSSDFAKLQELSVAEGKTDSLGEAAFIIKTSGEYMVLAYSGSRFQSLGSVYVNGGYEFNLTGDFYGFDVYVYDRDTYEAYSGVKVTIIEESYYSSLPYQDQQNLDILLEGSLFESETTDANGLASFDLLSGGYYYAIAYEEDKSEFAVRYEYISSYDETEYIYLNAFD